MKCSIIGCSNNRINNPQKHLFHAPRSTATRELWMKPTGRSFSLKSKIIVCEDHFDMDNDVDYYRSNGQPVLKNSVYPHRNLQESEMKMQKKIDNINWTCFVPHCENKRLMTGKQVIFFPVPEGMQGTHWKSAVTVYERNVNKTFFDEIHVCCEEHFDIHKDIEKIFHYNGLVEYKAKTGIVPSLNLEPTKTPIILENLNLQKQINLGDSLAHSRLILNNHISYLYNYKLADYLAKEIDIKVEPRELTHLSETKVESIMEEEIDVKTEPIDLDYEDGCNIEFTLKAEENELETDKYDSGSESELDSNKKYFEDPDVTTDDFSTESEDLISSDDSEISNDLTFSGDEDSNDDMSERSECPYCPKLVRNLDAHVERVHSNCAKNLNKTICGLCLEKFVSGKNLKDHQYKVHNGNGYACDLCDYMSHVYHRMKEHIINMHSTETHFLCDICGKDYKFIRQLKKHIHWKHSGNRERKHACHMCDRKYFELNALQLHIRSFHLNERPFHCKAEGCKKAFRTIKSFSTHKQVHMKRELFTCIACEKKFTFKWNLKTHIKNIHGA